MNSFGSQNLPSSPPRAQEFFDLTTILRKLSRDVSSFRPADVLASVGGLQLMPENAHCALRLETLAHLALSRDALRGRTVEARTLEEWCNRSELSRSIAEKEDRCENLFTQAFSFFGGSFVVFPGIESEPTFILRGLLSAIFLVDGSNLRPLQRAVSRTVRAALALSDAIAHRAGLPRGLKASQQLSHNVTVPTQRQLSHLKAAVSWTEQSLQKMLQEHGVAQADLEPLILAPGKSRGRAHDLQNGVLLRRPLVRCGSDVIVPIPSAILAGLRRYLLEKASELGLTAQLTHAFHRVVLSSAFESLKHLEHDLLPIRPVELPSISLGVATATGSFWSFDADKVVYVLVISDPLEGTANGDVLDEWKVEDWEDEVALHWIEIKKQCAQALPRIEVSLLQVLQGVGRPMVLGWNSSIGGWPVSVGLTATDLEVITFLEAGDPLALWKFARASSWLRRTSRVLSWSTLDEYHFWRRNGYTFHDADQMPINQASLINIENGIGVHLREEVEKQFDVHAAVLPDGSGCIEVMSLHQNRDIPFYFSTHLNEDRSHLLLEGNSIPIWVVGPTYIGETDPQQELHPVYSSFTQTITYWLWQLQPVLNKWFKPLLAQTPTLTIELFLPIELGWNSDEIQGSAGRNDAEEVESSLSNNPLSDSIQVNAFWLVVPASKRREFSRRLSLNVVLSPTWGKAALRGDNMAERLLMHKILSALLEVVGSQEGAYFSSDINEILKEYMPADQATMVFGVPIDIHPELDGRGLPPHRGVKMADANAILVDLGAYWRSKSIPTGAIAPEHSSQILNDSVGFLYGQLEAEVAELLPDGLLERLIDWYEELTHHAAMERQQLPTRVRCWGHVVSVAEQLAANIPKDAENATACRFLLEYLAARPPQGTVRLSLSRADRLMALASRIIALGMTSDAHRYHIADVRLAMTRGGVLEIDQNQLGRAYHRFLGDRADGEVYRATIDEKETLSPGKSQQRDARIDAATQVEWGFTLTEVADVGTTLINWGRTFSAACMKEQEEVEAYLEAGLGWPRDKVRLVLEAMILSPRANFLKPPSPWRAEDVYPWRFNRELSFLRRPFIRRETAGKTELVWGWRHVFKSLYYWRGLILAGKHHARSGALKALQSSFNDARGSGFNRRVGKQVEELLVHAYSDAPRDQSPFRVQVEFKKLLGLRLPQELGDVDVLAVDIVRHRIWVLQCKNFSMAGTPHEMDNELDKLFIEKTTAGTVPEKLQKQAHWVEGNLQELLTHLGFAIPEEASNAKRWKIEALIVVDEELVTPYLRQSPVPVVTLTALNQQLKTLFPGGRNE